MKSKPTLLFACLILVGVAIVFEGEEDTSPLEAAAQDVIASRSGMNEVDGSPGHSEQTTRAAMTRMREDSFRDDGHQTAWDDQVDPEPQHGYGDSEANDITSAMDHPLMEDYELDTATPSGQPMETSLVPAPTIVSDENI